jgi:hypothetical protein
MNKEKTLKFPKCDTCGKRHYRKAGQPCEFVKIFDTIGEGADYIEKQIHIVQIGLIGFWYDEFVALSEKENRSLSNMGFQIIADRLNKERDLK